MTYKKRAIINELNNEEQIYHQSLIFLIPLIISNLL